MSERGASDIARRIYAQWRTIMLVVVAALGVGVLTALIITTGLATRERDRALEAQSHSYEVMILTRSLAGSIADAEATLGRFVISTDKVIGQQFADQWVRASGQIDRLDAITNDNPTQQGRVFALRQAYKERGDELTFIALSTRYKKNAQALGRYYESRNSPSLARIDKLLDGFIETERALLQARSSAADRTLAQSNLALKIFAAFGVLLVIAGIVLGWLVVRSSTERAYADAEALVQRNRAQELEVAVADAVADLEAEAREREAAEARLRQVQKLDAVGQLTGGIAHDFNNMLAVVLGGIELAKRRLNEGGDDVARHLDNAADGASRASALTKRLLAFARSQPLLPRAVDPVQLIAGMSELLDRSLGDGIRLTVKDDAADWCIWVDSDGLENAILNLAVNARDAMDGRGRLTIATTHATLAADEVGHNAAGDYVAITVSDSGHGMSDELIERVFEPFFTTKPVGKGTGLGLSQVFGFIKASEGEVAIRSRQGKGTSVTLYIPRHAAPASAIVVPIVQEAPATQGLYDILVVEDDPRVLAATVELLTELGHRTVPCNDPLLALEKAEAMENIDLIISDVLMPQKTGPELVSELSPAFPDAAVLFVTGYAGDAEGEALGAYRVLRKPFTIAGLAAAVNGAVTQREQSPPPRVASAG